MDVVKVKDEFSWKSLGAKSDKYLKCTVSKEEQVLQRMRFDIFKMLCTNICNFFPAAELKKVSLSVGRTPLMLLSFVNQN